MSAPQTEYEQYPASGCQDRTVIRHIWLTWAVAVLAIVALATAIWAGSRPAEVAYYPSGGNTYGEPNPRVVRPTGLLRRLAGRLNDHEGTEGIPEVPRERQGRPQEVDQHAKLRQVG